MNKLMVLDGNSIVNRAFYGVSSNLTTRTGQPTNAVFGFLNILNKLLDGDSDSHVAAQPLAALLPYGCGVPLAGASLLGMTEKGLSTR